MKNKNLWVTLSLLNFCIVASLGIILRSKILFPLPWINYLDLLEAHFHFAFSAWISLALLFLMITEFLPKQMAERPIYPWLLSILVLTSYAMLLTSLIDSNGFLTHFVSYLFILNTYILSWVFIKDVRRAVINKGVRFLSIAAVICLILSSAGPIYLGYLHAVESLNPFLYRDASYLFLHMQYNGFFTLAVFALLIHKFLPGLPERNQKKIFEFIIVLTCSILPSLFLSFLWQDPNILFRIIAIIGSILILISLSMLMIAAAPSMKYFTTTSPWVRLTITISVLAFILKMILQSLTIFNPIGNAVFGDRPIIIGFLHLVFLVFLSPFILGYYIEKKFLHETVALTRYAIILFLLAVAGNEITLMIQGLGAMFLQSSYIFSWLLWAISILLFLSVILILTAKLRSGVNFTE